MPIKGNRKRTRKLLFQELYSMSFNKFDSKLFTESFYDKKFTFTKDEDYLIKMEKIVTFYEPFFIDVLSKYAPKFKIDKMSLSYTLPIYIALAEMFYFEEEIPAAVSINEAIELAKTYWDDSAKKVVNGVLNKALENHEELNKSKDNDFKNITESCFKK